MRYGQRVTIRLAGPARRERRVPSEEEPKCIGCKWGSYMITFNDGSHLETEGKPAILCVAPEGHPGIDDPDGYPCFEKKAVD
jgi:hypothetical protein